MCRPCLIDCCPNEHPSFQEASHIKTGAATVIEHQHEPAFMVQVLEPAPAAPSVIPTPKGSHAPTPMQSPPPELAEPTYISKILTVPEVASIVIGSLVNSAADFLGQKIQGAVITVPSNFSSSARAALRKSAESAGVHVLQLLDDPAAASLAYSSLQTPPTDDRTSLILDLGASSLDLALISIKQGLVHSLASSHTPHIGGDAIDDKLVAFFAKEFTKKTKVSLSPTSHEPADLRALSKLRLAVEHTKRTLSASPGAASCSVESLKDGMDFSGTINRLRFDIEMKPIYSAVTEAVRKLLESAGVDSALLDEVILVGATAVLPGLTSQLSTIIEESTLIRSEIDPSQVISRGAAVQAGLLASISPNDPLLAAFEEDCMALEGQVTTKTLGAFLPDGTTDGVFIRLISSETPLPARRTVSFVAQLDDKEREQFVGLDIWEVKENVKVEKTKVEIDEDDEEPEEIETKERIVEKETFMGSIKMPVVGSRSGKKKKGPLQAVIMVTMIVTADGSMEVMAHQKDSSNAPTTLRVAA
jgi:heat shock 70kDa protein 1/2/6/8